MPQTDNELKARMMARAEAAIDALLAKRKNIGKLGLDDIERMSRETGGQVMQGVTADLAEAEACAEEGRVCPECGQELIYKGRKARRLVTDAGEVCIERSHYYCPTCRKGIFPPRPSMGSREDSV